jgi:hypothetical protein
MLKGETSHQSKFLVLRLCLIMFLMVVSSACQTPFFTTPPVNIPFTELKECPPPANGNIYRPTPTPLASPAITPTPTPIIATPQGQIILTNKQIAFQNLISQVKRWTASLPINLDDTRQVRILVTFLSPDLIRAVSTNEAYLESSPDVESRVRLGLEQIASLDKLVFLMTILVINPDGIVTIPHTVNLSPNDFLLLSADDDLDVKPAYFDPNLNRTLGVSEHNVGYLYYPLAVLNNGVCAEVLNSKFDTNIILQASSITIDGVKNGPYIWAIEYKTLLNIGHTAPKFETTNSYQESDPQPTDFPPMMADDSDTFWREYSKFVWGHLMP